MKYLPEEWQKHLYAIKEEGQGILELADENLTILNQIVHAYPTMDGLRYIHYRLASLRFEATTEWMLENDMLTLAFVTTYTRLVQGGIGSGVSRKRYPPSFAPCTTTSLSFVINAMPIATNTNR